MLGLFAVLWTAGVYGTGNAVQVNKAPSLAASRTLGSDRWISGLTHRGCSLPSDSLWAHSFLKALR